MSTKPAVYSLTSLMLRLGIVAALAAAILTVVDIATQPARQAKQNAVITETMKAVLPPFQTMGDPIVVGQNEHNQTEVYLARAVEAQKLTNLTTFYPVFNPNGCLGYAVKSSDPNGYGGEITVMFGLTLDGTLGIVQVIAQNETPGLGTLETQRTRQKTLTTLFESDSQSGLSPNPYLDQFTHRVITANATCWEVKPGTISPDSSIPQKPYQTIAKTGATVTMKAINRAVFNGAHCYAQNMARIQKLTEEK